MWGTISLLIGMAFPLLPIVLAHWWLPAMPYSTEVFVGATTLVLGLAIGTDVAWQGTDRTEENGRHRQRARARRDGDGDRILPSSGLRW